MVFNFLRNNGYYIAILFNLCFLIFGALLGLGIDMIIHKWKENKQDTEKRKKIHQIYFI